MQISNSLLYRRVFVILISLLFLVCFTSVFPIIYAAPVCLLLVVVSFVLYGARFPNSANFKYIIAYMAISMLYMIFGRGSFYSFQNVAYLYILLFTIYMASPALRCLDEKEIRVLWYACLGTVAFSLVMTYVIGLVFPNIVRIIGFGGEDPIVQEIAQTYQRMGLLSYTSSHTLATVSALFIFMAFEHDNIWLKIIYLGLTFLAIYDCFSMTITTTFFASVICSLMMFAVTYSKGRKSRLIMFSVVGLIVISSSSFVVKSLSTLSDEGGSQISVKIGDIIDSMESGESSGQMESRENLYAQSIDAIINHPIIGGAKMDEPGQHSCLLDMIAYYGLFALLLFWGWWKELKQIKYYLTPLQWLQALVCLMGTVIIVCLKGRSFLPSLSLITIIFWQIGMLYIKNRQYIK